MELHEIKNIIEKICSSEELLNNGEFGNSLLTSNKGQQIPKCIKKSFTELYSILENELSAFITNESSGNSCEGNVQTFKLLSFLDENYLSALKERFSKENEKLVEKHQQDDMTNIGIADDIVPLDVHENNSLNTNRNKREKHVCFHHQPKLELEFIEQISIAPNILVANSPASSKSLEHKKGNVDDAHFDQSATEELEIVSAQKSLTESKRNSLSFLTTSTSTQQPSTTSEQNSSIGLIDEQMAVRLLAKYGKRICLYNVDADGCVRQKKQTAELGNGNKLATKANETSSLTSTSMEEQQSSQIKTIDLWEIDAEFDVINANAINTSEERHNLIEIVPQKNGCGAIVAREISFQSSFVDTAGLMKNLTTTSKTAKSDKECSKNSTKDVDERLQLHKESSQSVEDEETLNQITPIPTTLELSS